MQKSMCLFIVLPIWKNIYCSVFAERSKSRYLGDRLPLNGGRRQVFQSILSQARCESSATPDSRWPPKMTRKKNFKFSFRRQVQREWIYSDLSRSTESCGWTSDSVTPRARIQIGSLDQKGSNFKTGGAQWTVFGGVSQPPLKKK